MFLNAPFIKKKVEHYRSDIVCEIYRKIILSSTRRHIFKEKPDARL